MAEDMIVYKGHKINEFINDILEIFDFYIKNQNFDSFLDLFHFLTKYRKLIDLILEYIDLDDEEEELLTIQNFLRQRFYV
jgi:hypothetical protein